MSKRFFFVGASRTGSTWLASAFNAHPSVIQPVRKPVRFWNLKLYGGEDKKSSHPTLNLDEYTKLFEPEKGKLKADLTDGYHILCSTAINQIHRLFSDAKILFLMREPFEIVQSHFQLHITAGAVDRDRVNNQLKKITGYSYQNIRQIEAYQRWSEIFGESNVWVGFYEEFFSDAGKQFSALCEFLELKKIELPEELNLKLNQRRHTDSFSDAVITQIRKLCQEQCDIYANFRRTYNGPRSLPIIEEKL